MPLGAFNLADKLGERGPTPLRSGLNFVQLRTSILQLRSLVGRRFARVGDEIGDIRFELLEREAFEDLVEPGGALLTPLTVFIVFLLCREPIPQHVGERIDRPGVATGRLGNGPKLLLGRKTGCEFPLPG